jgi:hypothetical protein
MSWVWNVGSADEEQRAGPRGARARALLAILREARRCLGWFPTEEMSRAASAALEPYATCGRVCGAASVRAAVINRLRGDDPRPYAAFITPHTHHGGIPTDCVTDVVIYSAMPPVELRRAIGYAYHPGSPSVARVHVLDSGPAS